MFNRLLLNKLNDWSKKSNRKPLVIRGARQVGKTTLVLMFGEKFDQFIELNLEKAEDRNVFEKSDNISEIVKAIFFLKNKSLSKSRTLIFIDEIQNSVKAIKMLRYFFEEYKQFYIIAAGSLLETILNFNESFPVGRVEFLYLYPCSFTEFLMANEQTGIIEAANEISFPQQLHDKTLKLFSEYALIGGMPEVIKSYINDKDVTNLKSIYESLLISYMDDVEKYSKNNVQASVIHHIIRNCFQDAGKRIKYEGFGNTNYKYREIKEALVLLERAMLIRILYPTFSVKPPVTHSLRKSPKLMVLDTGLINYFSGIQKEFFVKELLEDVYEGRISEHIAGQELFSISPSQIHQPTFWVREKKQSSAEIDYVIQYEDLIIPVEVKYGKAGTLKSLMQFIDMAPHHYAVRVYTGMLSVEEFKTIAGKKFFLLNLPFYLVGNIFGYIAWLIKLHPNKK